MIRRAQQCGMVDSLAAARGILTGVALSLVLFWLPLLWWWLR